MEDKNVGMRVSVVGEGVATCYPSREIESEIDFEIELETDEI